MQSKGINKHEENHNNHRQFKCNYQSNDLFSEILIILFFHHISRVLSEMEKQNRKQIE